MHIIFPSFFGFFMFNFVLKILWVVKQKRVAIPVSSVSVTSWDSMISKSVNDDWACVEGSGADVLTLVYCF
jgi:hypothetical protein